MVFVVVWLRVENERDFGRAHKFSLNPTKTQSPQIVGILFAFFLIGHHF